MCAADQQRILLILLDMGVAHTPAQHGEKGETGGGSTLKTPICFLSHSLSLSLCHRLLLFSLSLFVSFQLSSLGSIVPPLCPSRSFSLSRTCTQQLDTLWYTPSMFSATILYYTILVDLNTHTHTDCWCVKWNLSTPQPPTYTHTHLSSHYTQTSNIC